MIVDTSALIAILRVEPEALSCAGAIENSAVRRVSTANLLEAAVIIDASRDPIASRVSMALNRRLELHGRRIAISAKAAAILPS